MIDFSFLDSGDFKNIQSIDETAVDYNVQYGHFFNRGKKQSFNLQFNVTNPGVPHDMGSDKVDYVWLYVGGLDRIDWNENNKYHCMTSMRNCIIILWIKIHHMSLM